LPQHQLLPLQHRRQPYRNFSRDVRARTRYTDDDVGEIAVGVCGFAVAFIGALMLTGRLPLRDGARVMVGCFVLLGAPVIAAGFVGSGSDVIGPTALLPPVAPQIESSWADLPPANFDPYAGASLRED